VPREEKVTHKKWSKWVILFDDGWYSAIWGNYENSPNKRLGVRWNGEGSDPGYPKLFKHPLWFVEREYLVKPILLELLFQASKLNGPEAKTYVKNIQQALSEV